MYRHLKEGKQDKKDKRKRSRESETEVSIQSDVDSMEQASGGSSEQSHAEETTMANVSLPGPSSQHTAKTTHHTLATEVKGVFKKAANFLKRSPVRREESKSPRRKDKSPSKTKKHPVPSESEIQERAFLLEDLETPSRIPGSPERKSRERQRPPSVKTRLMKIEKSETVCMPQSMMDASDGSCKSMSTSRSSFSESLSLTHEMKNLPETRASTSSDNVDIPDLETPDLLNVFSDDQKGEDTLTRKKC